MILRPTISCLEKFWGLELTKLYKNSYRSFLDLSFLPPYDLLMWKWCFQTNKHDNMLHIYNDILYSIHKRQTTRKCCGITHNTLQLHTSVFKPSLKGNYIHVKKNSTNKWKRMSKIEPYAGWNESLLSRITMFYWLIEEGEKGWKCWTNKNK